jgi:hypothetical protein
VTTQGEVILPIKIKGKAKDKEKMESEKKRGRIAFLKTDFDWSKQNKE